ncbi:PTS mannose transporter subunit IIAB [Gilliamella apicola]|uniref:PTS system mannose-specific EIIAB component n=1 Tax=Gilliamella apicola TaxID=1196095 RepID=A0A242NJ43_9GAMM|nr:mannose/fructose/sorbose PTS transporter subunit IIA [Gilliamella apicola]OTP81349.1 PTS mannose transporter subunit IIAB [Gilliamella apicola]OTP83436.1 PTS mannose transporter subunit IIAB [Gilliamella apicola]OTP87775.1 PTS mannose transporter subunit IIAB [Gilliamella apicola]OTP99987.1 PTS mannose transporter subunit IIAB [Gilliamella apicola]OTQ08821.1 PTS mannose transporter subunit IIAB [Gilliamella apicola]
MVGIILATHGEFAEGILQSGSMIFGEQENVKAITLHPSDSPESLKERMQEAIATFDNQDEVLFLVDLWGGTPFNQANNLCGEHSNWAIVAGLNLPMLIEAYSSRFSMETAKEIAAAIIEPAREGVKATVDAPDQNKPATQVSNTIPEGTVLGNGKMKIVLARVDSRLLHGQVATAWTKSTNPNRIIVVSDSVAKDELRKKLIQEAAPPGVKANVVPIKKIIEVSRDPRFGNTKALLLFENPQDVLRAIEGGVDIDVVNIGSMAHSVGKVMVNKVLSMNADDVDAFEKLKAKNVKFDVRKVPNDSNSNMDDLLKKAKEELAEQKN